MPYVSARDGTQLYVKQLGTGRPVILIHGWPLSADSWDPQMIALAENGYRAIAYDRRGFGRSDQPPAGYDYDTFADDLAAVAEATGATDHAALVGFSMGGGEVVRYMARHRGRGVSQAVLVSSVVPYLLKTDDNPHGVEQSTFDGMDEGMRKDFRGFFKDFFKTFYGIGMLSHPVGEAQLEWAWMTSQMAGQYATLQAAKAFAATDFRPDLVHLTVPVLVIHGTGDDIVPIKATSRAVADAVPTARLVEYPGEPHAVFATRQDRLTADLIDFLGGGMRGHDGATAAMRHDA